VKAPTIEDFDAAAASAAEQVIVHGDGRRPNFCLVPKCEVCSAVMKPHSMFFDESYSEHYYRSDTVMNFVENSDCLVVIGTALATSLAKRIVSKFLEKELPVIEVNMESAINRGHNIQVLGKSEETLPLLFSEFHKIAGPAATGVQSKRNTTTANSSQKLGARSTVQKQTRTQSKRT